MNRQKLISFIGRRVKGNWVSIILILTSSSINFKWLIRTESPFSLLVWSLFSSQFWDFWVQYFAAHCARNVRKFGVFLINILEVNTHVYMHRVITVMFVRIFERTLIILKYSYLKLICLQPPRSRSVCHLLCRTKDRRTEGQKDGFYFNFPVDLVWSGFGCLLLRTGLFSVVHFLPNFKIYFHVLKQQIYSNPYLSKH